MADANQPSLVRYPESPGFGKPGMHSHNTTRRIRRGSGKIRALLGFRMFLFVIGFGAIAFYTYTLINQHVYQAYENWAFDQQIAGRASVTFGDYLRERTPFGFLAGPKPVPSQPVVARTNPGTVPAPGVPQQPAAPAPLAEGALVGRVEVPRLNLSAIVREGVDAKTLSIAVGHIPSTALPGNNGNFAIAAHRDTLFRALKDIHEGDRITFQTTSGTYQYRVAATKIVKPSDVTVLRSDGGGLIPNASQGANSPKLLTMITCYPFYYVGAAPKRFIVEAEQVAQDSTPHDIASASVKPKEEVPATPAPSAHKPVLHHSAARVAAAHRPSSRPLHTKPAPVNAAAAKHSKKHGFWHRLLHTS